MASLFSASRTGLVLLKVMAGLGRTPLFISWNVTFKCNLRCAYCGAVDAPHREWETEKIVHGLEELYRAGARWITFGGGEPLLRSDIETLITKAKEIGFTVFVSTNGRFVPEKIDILRQVDNVNLSLDGPEAIHDEIRGAGAFADTMTAAKTLQENSIPFSYQCVLAKHNLNHLKETLGIAKGQHAWMMFQPATQWLDSSTAPNPTAPLTEPYRKAIDELISLKKVGYPIANSKAGLKHLRLWPDNAPIRCLAGRLMAVVEPDGTLLSCHQCEVDRFLKAGENDKTDMGKQFRDAPLLSSCGQCWCAPVVELALICSLKPEPIWNTLKRFWRELH